MKKVYFVRHGESEHNAANVFGGFEDVRLTEVGRAQAIQAGRKIASFPDKIGYIFASPLKRTQETALLIADEIGLSYEHIQSDERIIEIDDGLMSGKKKTAENRAERDSSALTKDNPMKVGYVGDMVERLKPFIDDVKKRPEDNVLIVGHAFSGRMLRRVMNGIDVSRPIDELGNAEVIQLYPYKEAEGEHKQYL